MNKLFRIFMLVTFCTVFGFACSQQGPHEATVPPFSVPPMLEPGDQIESMVITTGTEDALPLWAFCLPTAKNDHLITVDCEEVSFSRLAIGHTFGLIDLAPEGSDWSELNWELSLDGYIIDLNAFGTYSFMHPDLALHPSPIKEVFRFTRVWDVVLENPAPGAHVLYGRAQSKNKTYTWIVNFTIATSEYNVIRHTF